MGIDEAQCLGELGAIIAAPFGHRAVAAVAAQHRAAREGKERGEWVALPIAGHSGDRDATDREPTAVEQTGDSPPHSGAI